MKATNRNRRMIGQLMNNIQKVASISEGRDFKRRERIVDSVNFAAAGFGGIGATIFASKQRLFVLIKVGKVIVPKIDHAIVKNRHGSIVVTSVIKGENKIEVAKYQCSCMGSPVVSYKLKGGYSI